MWVASDQREQCQSGSGVGWESKKGQNNVERSILFALPSATSIS